MMSLQLGLAVLETWQAVVLIVLCFGSLIIALYCLLFMVPLKSFVSRINSLGGGMKGMRAHLDGVRNETESRIGAIDQFVRGEFDRVRAELRQGLDAAAAGAQQARVQVQRLDGAVQRLQADLRECASDGRKLSEGAGALQKELAEVRSDLGVVEVELRGAVNQLVSDSYQQVEGTVLGALEAMQDEMLRGAARLHRPGYMAASWKPAPPGGVRRPSGRDSGRRTGSKIISAKPLFGDLAREPQVPASEEGADDDEAMRTRQEPAPAK